MGEIAVPEVAFLDIEQRVLGAWQFFSGHVTCVCPVPQCLYPAVVAGACVAAVVIVGVMVHVMVVQVSCQWVVVEAQMVQIGGGAFLGSGCAVCASYWWLRRRCAGFFKRCARLVCHEDNSAGDFCVTKECATLRGHDAFALQGGLQQCIVTQRNAGLPLLCIT